MVARLQGCMISWLAFFMSARAYMVAWLKVAWLKGCMLALWHGSNVASLHACIAAMLRGDICIGARLHGPWL
jgi:hypothetical protein